MRTLDSAQPLSAGFDPSPAPRRKQAGFSLVEVVLAIGVVAFAFVGIFGLLPSGMTTFRKAMDVSVGATIFQKIVEDARQSDFSVFTNPNATASAPYTTPPPVPPLYFDAPMRYFDEAGTEVIPAAGAGAMQASLTPAEKGQIIFYVTTRVAPRSGVPYEGGGSGGITTPYLAPYLATVTVQIANNPGGITLAIDQTTQLMTNPQKGVTFSEFSALIAKED